MKLIFALLLMTAPVFAQANTLTCRVEADGVNIPQGSYAELNLSGPYFSLYRDYSRKTGPLYFVKTDLISKSLLSSWRIERAHPNCAVTQSDDHSIDLEYKCVKVDRFLDLRGAITYDAKTASGHYSQKGETDNGGDMNFDFAFSGCY